MMVEGEATQEPHASEGAPASPPAEPTVEPAAETPVEPQAHAEVEAEAPVEEAVAGPSLDWSHLCGLQSLEAPAEALAARADYAEELT